MANKTLGQVAGAGGLVVGDIIFTTANALADGKVLLDCDGSIVTPASYPDLEALLDTGIDLSSHYDLISADGERFSDDIDAAGYYSGKSAFSVTNDRAFICNRNNVPKMYYQNATEFALGIALASGVDNAVPAISDDGVEAAVGATAENASNDLQVHVTTDAWATGMSTISLATADQYTSGMICMTFINGAGTLARVVVKNQTTGNLETWTSGANIGTGWTRTQNVSITAATGVFSLQVAASDDLVGMCWTDGNTTGIWVTKDSGATWSEAKALPNGGYSLVIGMDSSYNVYAINAETYSDLYKSTDGGANWSSIANTKDLISLIKYPGVKSIKLLDIYVDRSDNMYLIGEIDEVGNSASANASFPLVIFYSTDAGVTWSASVQSVSTPTAPAGSAQWVQAAANNVGWGFQMNNDRSQLIYIPNSAAVFKRFDLTKGLRLPMIPGYKIVADAP